MHSTLAGYFKIEAVRPDGEVKVLADWFPNLILNQGLDRIGVDTTWINNCQVGADNTTPAATQTGLFSHVAGTSTIFSGAELNSGASPWYNEYTRVFSFAVGVATGTLSEVGVGWGTSGSTLFSRALILDGVGSPTSVTVLSDEILKVTYQFRRYLSEVDTTGTVTLNSIDYDYTGRVTKINSLTYWKTIFSYATSSTGTAACYTYNGTIGTVENLPSSASGAITQTKTISAYVPASYMSEWKYDFSLDQGNATTGIKSIAFNLCGGYYQVEFDTVIPKTIDDTLSLTFQATWARHV